MTDWDRDDGRLDLPLGEEEAPEGRSRAPSGPAFDEPAAEAPAEALHEVDRPARSRVPLILLGILALAVLLVLAVVVGYLLPRPGPPLLRASTSLVDFERVRVGETGSAEEVVLTSAGDRPVAIGELALSGPAADEFEIAADGCSGTSLAPGATCSVVVRFRPAEAAVRRADLEVPAEASGGPGSVALVGEGVAPRPVVDRTRVDFPVTPVGERSGGELLTVGNRGSAAYAVEGMAVDGPAAAEFGLDGDRCTGEVLAPGGTCTVRVVFAPAAEGERRAVLRFRSGRGAPAEDLPAVELRGLGAARVADGLPPPGLNLPAVPATPATPAPRPLQPPPPPPPPPPPEIGAEPGALDFGEVSLGARAEPEAVVFRNSGGSPARVEGLALAGADPGAFAVAEDRCRGEELAPGERCTARVAFRPRQEGLQRARLELRSPDLPEAPAVALAGAGAAGRLRVEPRELDFGEVRVSDRTERRLRLSNAGRAPLEVQGAAVAGGAAREFRVDDGGCPETVPLAPGERCELAVTFAPAEEGERRATLTVRHGGAGPAAEVPLSGTALPAPAPRIAVSPGALRFPDQAVGTRSAIATVTVANRGSARLELGELRIEGAGAGDFRIVPGSCEGAPYLVPGSECTVGIRFTPSAAGGREARLVVRHNAPGGRETVAVSGTGVP
ncbi:MAG TPA: choice-of-anchor D domain-containing protein [Thermoanaerobaculia bacterium]|nr:choice-of-anchor D domain-containing protein [Thermoanaerobaculia bacterium]